MKQQKCFCSNDYLETVMKAKMTMKPSKAVMVVMLPLISFRRYNRHLQQHHNHNRKNRENREEKELGLGIRLLVDTKNLPTAMSAMRAKKPNYLTQRELTLRMLMKTAATQTWTVKTKQLQELSLSQLRHPIGASECLRSCKVNLEQSQCRLARLRERNLRILLKCVS